MRNGSSYSGGRYCALIFALSLVSKGHKVTILTNRKPIFLSDFKDYKELRKIRFNLNLNNFDFPCEHYDSVIVFPDLNPFSSIYEKAVLISNRNNSSLILHSFETPNWFNSSSSIKKSSFFWSGWLFLSNFSSAIITMTRTSIKFSKTFYPKKIIHHYAYPPINEKLATFPPTVHKEKNIFIISRFGKYQRHKGGERLIHLFSKNFENYTFTFFGNIPSMILDRFKENAKKWNITINHLSGVSDQVKFEYLAKCESQIFLTSFEGYGYPPIEGLYVGTPSIVFPLEVFKETIKDSALYINNIDEIEEKYTGFIESFDPINERNKIMARISIDNYGKNLSRILADAKKIKKLSTFCICYIWLRYCVMYLANKLNDFRK